ncbi:MAG: glycosyltransferase family 1 protein [Gemmatimonadaceae bacterium]|nr:glycosyltransferase family 1 protein [Gemmatimonadaceae bacterium]
MARIVINSWGSYGDVNPYLALAVALSERGHEAVMALPEHFRDDVTRLGLPFHPVGRAIDLTSDEMPKLVEKLMDPRYGTTYLFRDVMMPSLRESYRQLREVTDSADMVVSQPLGFAAPLIAELTGIRWVSTVLAPLSFASGYEMSVPPPLPSLKKLEALGPWVAHVFARVMRVVSARWVEPVQQFRAELGLPRGKHPIFEGHFAAPLVLAMFSRVLATPQPDWPRNTHVTGQLVNDSAQGQSLAPRLQQFLENGEPPVVFTLGTSAVQLSGDFYDESIRAIARLNTRAVFLAGAETTARLASTLPPSMLMLDAAPHSLLMPRASVIVQQCGIGTLGTALKAGKPLLCVPFAFDQPDNAWRATRLGVGRTILSNHYRASNVIDVLQSLLQEPSFARRAAEVGAVVQAEDGAGTACDLIEQYLSQPAGRSPTAAS